MPPINPEPWPRAPPPCPLRRTIISLCRHITALDHRPVFPQERVYAESWWHQEEESRTAADAGGGGGDGEASPLASPGTWVHSPLTGVFSDDHQQASAVPHAATSTVAICGDRFQANPISPCGLATPSLSTFDPVEVVPTTTTAATAAVSAPWIGSSGVLHPVLSYLEPRHLVTAALTCR